MVIYVPQARERLSHLEDRITMKSIRSAVKKMDKHLAESDPAFNIAMVLIAAVEVGPNSDKIAKRAHLSRSVARSITEKCKNAGIFAKGKIHHGGWFDKESGGKAFWLDVACVQGYL